MPRVKPSKKYGWRPFCKILRSEGGSFFDSEVLILKYSKTYPYLLSLLDPSVQTYNIIHKHWNTENKFSDN